MEKFHAPVPKPKSQSKPRPRPRPPVPSFSAPPRRNPKEKWVRKEENKEKEIGKYWDRVEDLSVSSSGSSQNAKLETDVFRAYSAGKGPICFFCLHGAGQSAMSWAIVALRLKRDSDKYQVASYDLRGHGGTRTKDESCMSIDQLTEDTIFAMENMIEPNKPTILVGHSLGGALAVRVAKKLQEAKKNIEGQHQRLNLLGLVIVDVVEGTAVASLPAMEQIVKSRPAFFEKRKDAVAWALRHRWLSNPESAAASIPSQLCMEVLSTSEPNPTPDMEEKDINSKAIPVGNDDATGKAPMIVSPSSSSTNVEVVNTDNKAKAVSSRYVWRTDLLQSQRYWGGWFKGMTDTILALPLPKVLVLAGRDRMAKDTKLTVAQMQGKFQMVFVPKSGHSIQEDCPDKMIEVMKSFASRLQVFKHKQSI
eukprot:CAMPEP_0184482098 /NCGR_PEP_ID=MMETSP0113_2-20130426/3669_1 /TAXON_ID=91329 /ORGANISM="Norrisiella sphaerica, Strain BC52" /LENGTH=420 /DNA_ID=CAMNT_0026861639 /DNA_START=166 /DNA_END=1428 /DNA_ORIENTATION=+